MLVINDRVTFAPATHEAHEELIKFYGFECEAVPNLATTILDSGEQSLPLVASLATQLINNEYEINAPVILLDYRKATVPDQWGNDIFALVQYNSNGACATFGGHSQPRGEAGEGHEIVWDTYMD